MENNFAIETIENWQEQSARLDMFDEEAAAPGSSNCSNNASNEGA